MPSMMPHNALHAIDHHRQQQKLNHIHEGITGAQDHHTKKITRQTKVDNVGDGDKNFKDNQQTSLDNPNEVLDHTAIGGQYNNGTSGSEGAGYSEENGKVNAVWGKNGNNLAFGNHQLEQDAGLSRHIRRTDFNAG